MIYVTLLDLYQLGEEISLISVFERLRAKSQLDSVGGEGYITSLAFELPTAANIAYHARLVHQKALLRRVEQWALKISEQSKNGIEDVSQWLGEIESQLIDITTIAKGKKDPAASGILKEIKKYFNSVLNGESVYVPSPDFLEDPIPGFYPHLWMIGGYTSKGKSSLLNQILVDALGNGGRALVFSVEESREEKMMRMISNIEDIPYKALMTGRITGYEERIRKAEKQILEWNPIIYSDVRNMDEIYLKTKKHVIQDKINIVMLDYVQNLLIKNTLYETMVDASVKLFAMTRDLGITVIGVSQIDNESAKKESNIIGLKGAGELASAADIVLWVTRVKGQGKERHLDCTIKKNRPFGEVGKIELTFSEKWTSIYKRNLS